MTKTLRVVAALTLVLVAGLAPAVGAAAVGSQPAQLAIDQPDYIQQDVSTTDGANGTTVYHVRGPSVEITPTNFDPENVVSYGVETDGGELSYNEQFNEFEFSADSVGTYTVYWVTEYQTTVNQTVNGTTTTETVTRQQRYVAHIRVEGLTSMVHMQEGQLTDTRQAAQKWQEFNATVQELRSQSLWVNIGLTDSMTTQETVQAMINAYLLQNAPIQALSGNALSILFMLGATLGGLLIVTVWTGYHTVIIGVLYSALNRHEVNESAEGELSDRILNEEQREDLTKLANKDFADVWSDDHVASAMRQLGENPKDAYLTYRSIFSRRNIFHDRLAKMAQHGYVAVVDEEAATDGGADAETTIVDAHVAHEDDVPADADTHTLAVDSPEHDLLDALDWSQDTIREFDFVGAEFDPEDGVLTEYEEQSLPELIERTNLDLRQFDSEEDAAQYIREFLQDIREHRFTDDHGTPDTLRFAANEFLDAAHLLHDRFQLPVQYDVELWERVLDDHDPREQAIDLRDDVREGYYD